MKKKKEKKRTGTDAINSIEFQSRFFEKNDHFKYYPCMEM